MKNIILSILFLILLSGCATTKDIQTVKHEVKDAKIIHEVKTEQVPVSFSSWIPNPNPEPEPCPEPGTGNNTPRPKPKPKKIDETIKVRDITFRITNREDGSLKIDVTDPGHTSTSSTITNDHFENKESDQKKQVVQYRVPKWVFYLIAYALILTLWTLRRPILKVFAPQLTSIPFLKKLL